MSVDTSQLLSCSIVSAGFRITDYELAESAIIGKDGRTGRDVKVKVYGEVAGADAAGFATNLRLFTTALRSRDGLDFVVSGHGVEEIRLSGAASIDGGPWTQAIEIARQQTEGPLLKKVSFTVQEKQDRADPDNPNNGQPTSLKVTTAARADDLQQITYAGKFTGQAASDQFDTYLDARESAFPATHWLRSFSRNSTFSDTQVEWTITFTQLAVPISLRFGGFMPVDHEETRSVELDDKRRKVTTVSHDILLPDGADPRAAYDAVRPTQPPMILRETFSYTVHHESRVHCSFVTLEGADGNDLLDWEQDLQLDNSRVENIQPLKAFEFIGRDPILVHGATVPRKYVQSGRAVGINRFPAPPKPLFGEASLAEQPTMKVRKVNEIECETTWSYTYVFARTRTLQPADYDRLVNRPAGAGVTWLDNPFNLPPATGGR